MPDFHPKITYLDPTLQTHTPQLEKFINNLIKERRNHNKRRICASLNIGEDALFAKIAHLESPASRLRVSLGLRRRSGALDWPIAELKNSLTVNQITTLAPRLRGYSYVRGQSGLINEVILIYENMTGFLDGMQWLNRHPNSLDHLLPHLIDCIIYLNSQSIYHLDLKLENFMLSDQSTPNIKVIDFENCYLKKSKFNSETLGYQLGLLYECDLFSYVNSKKYDDIVQTKLTTLPWIKHEKFLQFYNYYKEHGAGRKERYLIPHRGHQITGKRNSKATATNT